MANNERTGLTRGLGKTAPFGRENYIVSVVRGRQGVIPGIIRVGLALLSLVYAAGLKLYLFLYRVGVRRSTYLPCPVVCVGNITTGGTGKTPTTQMLCRMLVAQGKRISVIIRGYLGENEHGCALVSDGERVLLSAAEAGDEAFLLAKTLPGVPVAAGRDRIRTGRLVFEKFQPDIVVMDDGMQHWRLHRDLDILLLNACRPFDNGWTVPRGMLREPKRHIRRAGIVLLTNARRAGDPQVEAVREEVANLAPGTPVFYGDLAPLALLDLQGQVAAEPGWLSGRRVAAVSALGNPASFEATLEECGAVVAARFQFPDHHAISREELDRTMEEARLAGAEAILTTEKDAVKLPATGMPLPLLVLQVAMSVQNETEFVSAVLSHLQGADGSDR